MSRLITHFAIPLVLLCTPLFAHSAVYKCLDEIGRVSYSQSACEADQQVEKILRVSVNERRGEVQCGILKNFVAEVGIGIEQGKSAPEVAEPWGGEDALSSLALKVIRSVYEYQRPENFKQTEDSIEHEGSRCQALEYGYPSCADFPVEFVSQYGGCDAARYATLRGRRLAEARAALPQQAPAEPQISIQEKVSMAVAEARERSRLDQAECDALRTQLEENTRNMQRDMDPNLRQSYEMERRALENALRSC
ncbi:DUF4124 domain-containing protein [Granulosicoccaceae sp. 1_MG-2023]|nr:DUF4124 domain-containing protein [Granulosicoccaceae sp. 1_MG-2023]